jgi:phage protein D
MELTRVRAAFQVTANDQDITRMIAERFAGLRVTDETGISADLLEITLVDHDPANPIQIPPKGAELAVSIGWEGSDLVPQGLFVCDEIELGGWPAYMVIRARAAVYETTPKGKTDMQTQKVRAWPAGTKLGDMAKKIAQEHGMAAAVSPALAGTVLPRFDQTEESDISFLLRVAKRYDAIVKPAGGKLLLTKRGASQSAEGVALPKLTIEPGQCADFTMVESSKESPGTVVAYWHSTKGAAKIEIKAGSGEPVRRLRHYYPTAAAATAAAEAELDRRRRGQHKFTARVQGDPLLSADATLVLSGAWRPGVAGDWLISRVAHVIDAGSGYTTELEAEQAGAD